MKKTLLFIWGLLCCYQAALAQEYFERDGISYRVIEEADESHLSGTVVVTEGEYQGEILIPNGVKQSDDEFADTYRVIGVDESAFDGSSNLKKVTLPLSVEYIGRWAFRNTPTLEEVVMPTGKLTTIGISAFMNSGIKSIIIPKSVKTIEVSAFYGCSNLKQVFIPANVRKIGMYAFEYCDNLNEVVFEEGCKKIPFAMFNGCNNIWRVTIPTTMLEIARDAFSSPNLKKVYVPQSCNVSEGAFNKNTLITHDSEEQPEQKKMDIGDNL